MLPSMDFQATLTKDAVIEYTAKYMTKLAQASLITEHSFRCLENAREQLQGPGSLIPKLFNLRSITDVKSQLEMVNLVFKDIRLQSKSRMLKWTAIQHSAVP